MTYIIIALSGSALIRIKIWKAFIPSLHSYIVLLFSILIFCTVFPYFLTELNKLIYYLNQNSLCNLMVSQKFHKAHPQLIKINCSCFFLIIFIK